MRSQESLLRICLARLGKSKVQGEWLGRAEQLLKDVASGAELLTTGLKDAG